MIDTCIYVAIAYSADSCPAAGKKTKRTKNNSFESDFTVLPVRLHDFRKSHTCAHGLGGASDWRQNHKPHGEMERTVSRTVLRSY